MANVRNSAATTVVSILGSIAGAAGMITKTIDTASASVDMMDRYVQRANDRQIKTHIVEDDSWFQNMLDEAAKDQQQRTEELRKFYQNNEKGAKEFDDLRARLASLFTETNA